jgi:hypothetical protein
MMISKDESLGDECAAKCPAVHRLALIVAHRTTSALTVSDG